SIPMSIRTQMTLMHADPHGSSRFCPFICVDRLLLRHQRSSILFTEQQLPTLAQLTYRAYFWYT
ncbi:MAG: hypothetical protein J7M34_01075, partial [Anaerolineae bacterium]|nr:hypothetical protein [Anaerolineae bacterium]